ncbi:hypothetical protein EVG20_g11692 [Dentipellis fragilis]|uniref:Uncharacterized protein n=1 Tax=Dentipellis fragilis TaxID=205917 RepID=A0A4Y9XNM2_9AGAM|nr:hypothetical protein EVG20_g11692 [Dentipellis fragilis]
MQKFSEKVKGFTERVKWPKKTRSASGTTFVQYEPAQLSSSSSHAADSSVRNAVGGRLHHAVASSDIRGSSNSATPVPQTDDDNGARTREPNVGVVPSPSQQSHSETEIRKVLIDAAKLTVKAIRDASDAFPPLKSATGGLCVIIDSMDRSCRLWVEM